MDFDVEKYRGKWKIKDEFFIMQIFSLNKKINQKHIVNMFSPEDNISKGISIDYDLKKYMGNQKNIRMISKEGDNRSANSSIGTSNITKQIEDIKKLKKLLDINIIAQEEFELKKKNSLGI